MMHTAFCWSALRRTSATYGGHSCGAAESLLGIVTNPASVPAPLKRSIVPARSDPRLILKRDVDPELRAATISPSGCLNVSSHCARASQSRLLSPENLPTQEPGKFFSSWRARGMCEPFETRDASTFPASMYMSSDDPFPDFVSRDTFPFHESLHWLCGHMVTGRRAMENRARGCDSIVEVRDARAPLTTAPHTFTASLPPSQHRVVFLNKADLVEQDYLKRTLATLRQAGLTVLAGSAATGRGMIPLVNALIGYRRPRSQGMGQWSMLVGTPNTGKSSLIASLRNAMIQQARWSRNFHRMLGGINLKRPRSCITPGTTKQLMHTQISNCPLLFVLDSPGLSHVKTRNPEVNLKIAALGGMPAHTGGLLYIGDYILFRLNRMRNFGYVDFFDMPNPTNDIQYLSAFVAQSTVLSDRGKVAHMDAGCATFIRMFQIGQLGPFHLDALPEEQVYSESLAHLRFDPPGPWGPSRYPAPARGLT